LKVPRILPYVLGLVVLAFALGSLPHGTTGGSLLFNSYWLLYLFYLGPVIVLGAMVVIIIMIGMNYRDIASAIGFNMAQRRRARKKGSRTTLIVKLLFWALAIVVLVEYKGSIFNPIQKGNSTIVAEILGEKAKAPDLIQTGGVLLAISNLVRSTWFGLAFLGLLVVGGVIVIQSVRISLKETRDLRILELQGNQEQGLLAIQEAIKLVDDSGSDPRSRIIACYQHLVSTVSRLGAPISSDLTARELDRAVRSTFGLKGQATTDLTQLFEEARYSLHQITDDNATEAHQYLESVAAELQIQLERLP
jgi:Domain of unknown function (DUF4129)